MPYQPIPASFASDDAVVETGPRGQRAHRAQFVHLERLTPDLFEVRDGVWCVVGNGLSNQTFVLGPDGLIVIDTGESREEMAAALAAVREHTDAPIAAVIYSHFHYCSGTTALLDDTADGANLPIWGHEKIGENLLRMAVEVGPAAGRGLISQFGMLLPQEGADGLVSVGLGLFYKNPAHGAGTPGHLPVNQVVTDRASATIAGLRVDMTHAPSDADDNLNIFFPDLDLCVNNIAWPALFNVFAIRGEEYRDPRVLLGGLDEILAADPEYLVGAHGPPLVGRARIQADVTDARDAIQFLWDQTVRGINKGLTINELIEFVQLPPRFERTYLTHQNYGLVEHHVRQIHAGLRGWFDGDEATLFPLPTVERARRLIDGFGGRDEVATQARDALAADDLRWALELASWLVRSEPDTDGRADGGSTEERGLLGSVLRAIAQRTTSANIRNWCLTRARELEGELDLSRFRTHRFGRAQVLAGDPVVFIHGLRVLLDPDRAEGVEGRIRWRLTDGPTCGLHVRGQVAVPTDGTDADDEIALSHEALADLLGGRVTFTEGVAAGIVRVDGDVERVRALLACFEIPSLV